MNLTCHSKSSWYVISLVVYAVKTTSNMKCMVMYCSSNVDMMKWQCYLFKARKWVSQFLSLSSNCNFNMNSYIYIYHGASWFLHMYHKRIIGEYQKTKFHILRNMDRRDEIVALCCIIWLFMCNIYVIVMCKWKLWQLVLGKGLTQW